MPPLLRALNCGRMLRRAGRYNTAVPRHPSPWIACSLTALLSLMTDAPRADVAPSPESRVQVLDSPGCTMRALRRAVERHQEAATNCLGSAYEGKSVVQVQCSFAATGAVAKCQAQAVKKTSAKPRTLACVEKAMSAMRLNPKAGDPTTCQAQIEVSIMRPPYHRPRRHDPDPDNPLSGV